MEYCKLGSVERGKVKMDSCGESRVFDFKSDLLNRRQAAEYLGVTPATLAVWACTKRYKLPFIKIGRLVKYRRSDLEMFISERSVKVEG